jgi:iron complex outermembrane receptor protein
MKNIRIVSLAAIAIAGLAASGAIAQTAPAAPPAADDATETSTIIVTGTRTTGMKAADSPAPIQLLGSDALKRTGQPDLIQSLAQNLPSIQAQAFGSDLSAHHLSLKLRGLSPNHTLILLNGHRRHGTANVVVSGGPYGGNAAADVGLIPADSIDHVEVLQDGAAAQYGTDAIAGVVNFIQKRADHGGVVNMTGGKYFDEGGKTYSVSGNVGLAPFEGAYLNLTAEQKYHGYSFRGDIDPRVTDNGTAVTANPGKALLVRFPNLVNAADYPYVNRIGGDARIVQSTFTYNSGYDFSPDLEFYSFGSYAHKTARAYENYRLPTVVVGKMATDIPFPLGFAPQEVLRQKDYAATAGFKGTFADTTFDLSTTYGKDINQIYVEHSSNAALYNANSTATTVGFSPTSFHDGDFIATQWTNALDLTHEFDIGLAEPLNVAAGLEYRHETYEIRAGDPASYFGTGAQSFFGYSPVNAGKHSRDNFSQYLDLSVKPIDRLLIDGAVRHEHYSDFGDTTVFKLTGRYDFTSAIAIRGTASTGFRAPTLAEEFYSGINVGPTSVSGVFAPNSPGAILLGLSGLKPEKSTNFSAGFVFHPARSLTITLDAYQIEIRNRIVQSGTFYGYNSNKNIPQSDAVTQALIANGVAIDPAIMSASSGSIGVQSFVNGLKTRTRGIDLVVTYNTDFDNWGKVDWSLNASYNAAKILAVSPPPSKIPQTIALLDDVAKSQLIKSTPKFRATAGAFWTLSKFSLNLRESFYSSSYQYANFAQTAGLAKLLVKSSFITDAELSYQVVEPVKLSLGANNLFNHYPTKNPAEYRRQLLSAAASGYASSVYSTASPIGINGGYYYARATFKF